MADFTGTATLSGAGTFTAARVVEGVAALAGAGTFSAISYGNEPTVMVLEVLDPTLKVAPTSVVVTLTDAAPDTDVVFDIDGTVVLTVPTDGVGGLGPTSLPVSEALGTQGSHTITATQGALVATGTFTLNRDPNLAPIVRGPDAQAVDVPAAVDGNGIRHWVLQDLMPGGLGSYVMEANPSRMTAPHRSRVLTARHSTAQAGDYHIYESGNAPLEWQFSGYCGTQAMHDQLVAFGDLDRRFYVIDHRGRAWKVTFLNVDMVARRRQTPRGGLPTDWGHDYTITALIYDQRPVTPAFATAGAELAVGGYGTLTATGV